MRSDEWLDESIRTAPAWTQDPSASSPDAPTIDRYQLEDLEKGRMSLSGHERNHLFLNVGGKRFEDISGISGLDSEKDSRSFALWDYDRDGWQDIVLANTNTPVLNLFHNELGAAAPASMSRGRVVVLRFVGGNRNARPSPTFGARDGYGAWVTVKLSDQTLTREHRCGEGFAAQNSATMLIGIGANERADAIEVAWPRGAKHRIENVEAGALVTCYEDAAESSDGSGFDRGRYLLDVPPPPERANAVLGSFVHVGEPSAAVCMYTSMATWCKACREHMPELKRLRERFSDGQLCMIGVPIDAKDTAAKLNKFIDETRPPYEMNEPQYATLRERFKTITGKHMATEVVPTTILTNRKGDVLSISPGVPTASDIARALRGPGSEP